MSAKLGLATDLGDLFTPGMLDRLGVLRHHVVAVRYDGMQRCQVGNMLAAADIELIPLGRQLG